MNCTCSLLLLLSLLAATRGQTSEMEEVEDLLKLESTIELRSAEKLILLLGSTGTGKSTLAKFLIGDKSLQLKQVGQSFIFEDNASVGNNIRKSMTIVPNVYQDPQTRELIVDSPGFSDTREPKYEIANAFFIKKVLEHAKKLKIVITENYFSLTEGMDRFGFSRLLRSLAELVPNIEKLKGSMVLVATKANRRGNAEYVKTDLLNYLTAFKTYLEEDLNSKANVTIRGMLRALDVLSGYNPAENVAFFWKPMAEMEGRLPIQELTNESKASIRSLIFDKMSWADNTDMTYHYSLTKESALFIKHTLAPASIEGTTTELRNFFANFKEKSQLKISTLKLARERSDFVRDLQSNLTSLANLTNVDEILNLTQSLSTVASVDRLNADVVKHLSSRAKFFKVTIKNCL
jgi:GTP-binding protein EngB required for normal cell division